MADSDSEGEGYSPPLPTTTPKDDKEEKDEDDSYIPALPPHLRKAGEGATTAAHESQDSPSARQETDSSESEDEGEEYCPALPPHMVQGGAKRSTPEPPQRRDLVGPMLPKGFVPPPEAIKESDAKKVEEEEEKEEEEEDSVLGPVPSMDKVTPEEYRAQEFEERARKMREKLEGRDKGSSKPMARESWMTELPEDKANFCGLGARQFLRKTPKEKGDRSCWTDTPSDKAKKEKDQEESPKEELSAVEEAVTERDKELTEKVDEYNKTKRAKPLVDLHRTELKRKQGNNEGPKERRPFSREEDMNVNKFDDAQKETIMKKARQLNDRFSSGKAKFL